MTVLLFETIAAADNLPVSERLGSFHNNTTHCLFVDRCPDNIRIQGLIDKATVNIATLNTVLGFLKTHGWNGVLALAKAENEAVASQVA